MGIAVGVPVGLFVNRKQIEQEEIKRSHAEEKKRKRQVTKIVSLLGEELSEGLKTLRLIEGASKIRTWTGHYPIKVELWRAFSDGGEIQWIDDPDLLNALAAAYYHLSLHNAYQNALLAVRGNSAFSSDVFEQAITAITRLINDTSKTSIDVVTAAEKACGQG